MKVIVSEWNPPRNPPREVDVVDLMQLVLEHDVMMVEKEGTEGKYIAVYLDTKGGRFRQR